MFLLNLKDCYPELYTEDQFVLVSNEVYKLYEQLEKDKKNTWRNTRRRPKNIPLDDVHALEIHLVTSPPPLFELVQMNLASEALHEAIYTLPKKQAKRIYEYYFWGYSKTEIAKMEGVSKVQITKSIQKALQSLREILKNTKNF